MSALSPNPSALAEKMLANTAKFDRTGLTKTAQLAAKTKAAVSHLGKAMPLAIRPGEAPIEAFIFETAGSALEKMSPKLFSQRI